MRAGTSGALGIYLRILAGVLIIVLAGVAGYLLGGLPRRPLDKAGQSASKSAQPPANSATESNTDADDASLESVSIPPFFLAVNVMPGCDLAAVTEEIRMAARAGIHNYILPVSLVWPDDTADPAKTLEPVARVAEADPDGKVVLRVLLDPPSSWLAAHPGDIARGGEQSGASVSIASQTWQTDAKAGLQFLIKAVADGEHAARVIGFELAALKEGRWWHQGGYDQSEASAAGFQRWIQQRYTDDAQLQVAWGNPKMTRDTVQVPEDPDTKTERHSFFSLPDERRHVDFRHYVSDSTADAIAMFAVLVKRYAGPDARVIAPYGFSFELTNGDSGHGALGRLLESEIDGLAGPVSYFDRGPGGAGGVSGPIHSALYHGKQWLILDDTRTGVARDSVTGATKKLEGLRSEDVYSVQRRNFALALAGGLGLVWADPEGDGRLYDADMWNRFGKMREAYTSFWAATRRRQAALEASGTPLSKRVVLSVVVDEESRFYQQNDTRLNRQLLNEVRDCALRAGVPTHFCLLQDVIDGKATPASVYLFLNAFRLTTDMRQRLHTLFTEEGAVAIWMYAPGYIGDSDTASAANIAATTRIGVKAFAKPARGKSLFDLPNSKWVAKDEAFGAPDEWDPLFYIEDEATNVIAHYEASKKPSVAVQFLDEGWTSVYVAEPALSPGLLREILGILEVRSYFRNTPAQFGDVAYFGPNLVALHGKGIGERVLDLGDVFDVQDLLQPSIGWPRKSQLNFRLDTGETRILRLTPVQVEE